jgi:hypothetical protein
LQRGSRCSGEIGECCLETWRVTGYRAVGHRPRLDASLRLGIEFGTVVANAAHVADARFRSLKDEDLADVWYALSACGARHPHQFKALTDAVLNELLERRGDGLKWLERRFQAIRRAEPKEDV